MFGISHDRTGVDEVITALSAYQVDLVDAFGLDDDDRKFTDIPAGANDHGWTTWRVGQATFLQIVDLMSRTDANELNVMRAVEYCTAVDQHGMEHMLTPELIRALPTRTGVDLVRSVSALCNAPSMGEITRLDDHDGVIRPTRVRMGDDQIVTFDVRTYGELQLLAAAGATGRLIQNLFEVSDDPELVLLLAPYEGQWFIETLLPVIAKAARKYVAVARSYEVAMKSMFAPETAMDVIASAQNDYQRIFKKQATDRKKKN